MNNDLAKNESISDSRLPGPAVRIVLVVGMSASLLLMVAGITLAFIERNFASPSVPMRTIIPGVLTLQPDAFMALGALTLIATPLFGIMAAVISLAGRRNKDAGVGIIVLAVIAVSFWLAYLHTHAK